MFVLVLLYESRKNGGIFLLTNSQSINDRLELELKEMHTLLSVDSQYYKKNWACNLLANLFGGVTAPFFVTTKSYITISFI